MEGFDTSGLIPDYLDDARGHMDNVDSWLLEMEKDIGKDVLDVEIVSDMLGALHTLKGNSGMMGFSSLQQYVHQIEGVLKRVLEDHSLLTPALLQRLFDSAHYLREALDRIEKDHKNPPDLSAMIEILNAPLEDGAGARPDAGPAGEPGPAEEAAEPPVEPEGSEAPVTYEEVPAGPSSKEKEAARAREDAAVRADSFKYIGAKSNILKVEFERLDELLNLAGELVIHRTKLAQLDTQFREAFGDTDLVFEFSDAYTQIHKATSDLQEAIMKVRMLPIGQVFQRFPRMVRDLSKERGKEINLTFRGEHTELDKTVIDEIGEPLLHLIRNSIDHGIETPEERVKKGKSQMGEISLTAEQEGNHIVITVSDNGRGIDLERIKTRAVKSGRHTREEVDSMARENLLDLVFESGFSTAREVSEISGRGVGLDIVKKNVSGLGGIVDIDTEPGRGTTFTIKLPLTLAIISSLMVESGRELYALPLASVVESLRLDKGEAQSVNNREVIKLRDRVLPLVRLSTLFGTPVGEDNGKMYIVVVGRGEKRVGLVVDRLVGRQEIVIKSLDDFIGEAEGIAGATILGDGKVVLILDISGLMEHNVIKADKRVMQP